MQQATSFVDDLFAACGDYDPTKLKVLDYGCGWGRMVRLLYRRVLVDNITGADAWQPSLERCNEYGVHGNLQKVDYLPTSCFLSEKYNIIFLFSVFTHLSDFAQKAILRALQSVIAEDGLLAVSIRQRNYWSVAAWPGEQERSELLERHLRDGAFVPHGSGGQETPRYGDTSMTLDYIREEWRD